MSLYFFNVKDGQDFRDETGTECATFEDVRTQALHAASDMLGELGLEFWQSPIWTMWVTDRDGETVLTLNFSVESMHPRQMPNVS